MFTGETVAIVIASMTGIGLIGTWIKNGRKETGERTKIDTVLKSEVGEIKNAIKSPEYGLFAINKKLEDQLLYCAQTSTLLKEKVTSLEKENSQRKKS